VNELAAGAVVSNRFLFSRHLQDEIGACGAERAGSIPRHGAEGHDVGLVEDRLDGVRQTGTGRGVVTFGASEAEPSESTL
jgi:hypothetical protein